MSKIETGGPAFPGLHPSKECRHNDEGMTLRDYFAAKAMTALIEKCAAYDPISEKKTQNLVAKFSYMFSDAMLEARK